MTVILVMMMVMLGLMVVMVVAVMVLFMVSMAVAANAGLEAAMWVYDYYKTTPNDLSLSEEQVSRQRPVLRRPRVSAPSHQALSIALPGKCC
jgi:hypothetical protein